MTSRTERDVIDIGGRPVGPGHPCYIIAELSANHGGRLSRAVDLVGAAAEAGADAVKLQTYTPEGMTLDIDRGSFVVGPGTPWTGRTLFDLYREAMTPWEWHAPLAAAAGEAGIALFSAPFDGAAVAFLDELDVPALKIASFELIDVDLIAAAGATGRPLILSTGMATEEEIAAGVAAARSAVPHGAAGGLALLRCNSAYPAPAAEMDLRTIPDMAARWGTPVGLSDHTLGHEVAVAAVALGVSIVEKHITWTRDEPGPDSAFSLEPAEFAALVRAVRMTEDALGAVRYGPSPAERASLAFRRSLYVVRDLPAGHVLADGDVRSLRPAGGLPPAALASVLGRRLAVDAEAGTAVSWDLLG